jgi:hypothetical protein
MPPKSAEKLKERNWLYDAYVNQGMTMDEVAAAASCSRSQVARAMKKYGIARRKPKSKYLLLNDKEWLVDAYVNQGMSTVMIAELAGCSDGSGLVYGMLKLLGVPLRNLEEAQRLRVAKGRGTGENASNWKGGRTKHSLGYMFVRRPDHPNAASNGYVPEHRLVMEEQLGRYLNRDEVVHHIDGDKTNNSPDNLVVMVRSKHKLTHKEINTRLYVLESRVRELEAIVAEYERRYGTLN